MDGIRLALIALLIPCFAFAEDSQSSASASGTVVNQALQTNNSTGADLSMSTFSRGHVTCAGSSLGMSLIPSFSNGDYNDNNNVVGMITFTMPTNLNGTVSRCKEQQAAMISLARKDARRSDLEAQRFELLMERDKLERDLVVIKACSAYAKNKTVIRSVQFDWAHKCEGLIYYPQSPLPAVKPSVK